MNPPSLPTAGQHQQQPQRAKVNGNRTAGGGGGGMSTGTPQQQQNANAKASASAKSKKAKNAANDENRKLQQRVFLNKSIQQQNTASPCSSSSRPPPLMGIAQHQSVPLPMPASASALFPPYGCSTKEPKSFGPIVPDFVMEDVLFRFLYNIPDNEKQNQIRVCFHIEAAHWFFIDFCCSTNGAEVPERLREHIPCAQVGFGQFVRQVFHKCDYLEKWRPHVDKIITNFNKYKSSVPTYGVIMLDSTLNYVLLVQGYFASRNSWGFPKGKVNEDEVPLGCALREALEEVGFDATDHIKDLEKCRPLTHFFGDTLVRLFIATDVPMDYPFRPHLRKEIRKICWFCVRDLPKYPRDNESCARLGEGFAANCFNSVIPFTKDICDFIERERRERNKPKPTMLKPRDHGSAFQPVIPRASSLQKLGTISLGLLGQQNATATTCPNPSNPSILSSKNPAPMENLFKPLKPADQPTSFTGQSFLEHIGASKSAMPNSDFDAGQQQIAPHPAGVIGGEFQRRRSQQQQNANNATPEIVHPKPLLVAQQLQQIAALAGTSSATAVKIPAVIVVYEASAEEEQLSQLQQPQASPEALVTAQSAKPQQLLDTPTKNNEIVDMLRSSIIAKTADKVQPQQRQKQELQQLQQTPSTSAAAAAVQDSLLESMEKSKAAEKPAQTTPLSTRSATDQQQKSSKRAIVGHSNQIGNALLPFFTAMPPPPILPQQQSQREAPPAKPNEKRPPPTDFQQLFGQLVPTQVRKCEAWKKKFTLDRSCPAIKPL